MVHVTAFFAGLLALLYIGLSVYVVKRRGVLRVALGDAGDESIIRRIRAHANFAEYVPFALLLMGLDELNGTYKGFLAFLGILLVLARLSHAYSLMVVEAKKPNDFRFRMMGAGPTFLIIGILAVIAIF